MEQTDTNLHKVSDATFVSPALPANHLMRQEGEIFPLVEVRAALVCGRVAFVMPRGSLHKHVGSATRIQAPPSSRSGVSYSDNASNDIVESRVGEGKFPNAIEDAWGIPSF